LLPLTHFVELCASSSSTFNLRLDHDETRTGIVYCLLASGRCANNRS
jgi:hypothetical protein